MGVSLLATTVVGQVIGIIASLFLLVLLGRLVFDYVGMFVRDFSPRGPLLIFVEILYTITDPPLRALRRVIPPLRLGNVSIDLAFMVLWVVVFVIAVVIAPRL